MKNILLVNIGNSNLRHPALPQNTRLPDANFREASKSLLERFDEEKDNMEVALIPEWLQYLQLDSGNLFLYGSDNPKDGDLNKQDTVYAAQIVARLIQKEYSQFEVISKSTPLRPIDADGLMRFFRNELLQMLKQKSDCVFYLLDAGGTPQQKLALKLNLEFLLPPTSFHVFNAERDLDNKTVIKDLPSVEYRRMIGQIQARSLVRQYNYQGALAILTDDMEAEDKSRLAILVSFVERLFSNHPSEASRLYEQLDSETKRSFPFSNLSYQIFPLQLVLEIARVYLKRKEWSIGLLYHHIFYERALSFLIEEHLSSNGYEALIPQMEEKEGWAGFQEALGFQKIFPNVTLPADENAWEQLSLPVKYELVKSLRDEFSEGLTSAMSRNKLGKLSRKRNKVAHEGRHISKEDISPFIDGFKKWYALMKINDELLWFDSINVQIEKLLLL
jgi:hypothetical protein